jgi:competence protein ComEC
LKIHYNDVGQGDSIILEWEHLGTTHLGVIDSNVYRGTNPALEFLKVRDNYHLEFIVLTHFHDDHFSGMADIMKFCMEKKVQVKYFYHTLAPFILDIYNKIFTKMKLQAQVKTFFDAYETFSGFVVDVVPVNSHTAPIMLSDTIRLSFLAPLGKVYDRFTKQLSRKVNKVVSTAADINKLATIIHIEKGDESVLLTSDAVKNAFKSIRNKISSKAVLVQAPHHGSTYNIDEKFWLALKKDADSAAIFSVGDEPRDKLPNFEAVKFFSAAGYRIHATNYVYGIAQHFGPLGPPVPAKTTATSLLLNSFSTLRKRSAPLLSKSHLTGDQVFDLF